MLGKKTHNHDLIKTHQCLTWDLDSPTRPSTIFLLCSSYFNSLHWLLKKSKIAGLRNLCSSTNYPTRHNPPQTQLSITLPSTLFFFLHAAFTLSSLPTQFLLFFIYFLHPRSSVAHQLQQLAEVTPAGGRMHAGGVQLTDRAQSVLPKLAYNLRKSDSQAPPGLTVAGFTWLHISCTSRQAARRLPVTFLSKLMSMDRWTDTGSSIESLNTLQHTVVGGEGQAMTRVNLKAESGNVCREDILQDILVYLLWRFSQFLTS